MLAGLFQELKRARQRRKAYKLWEANRFAAPSPGFVKEQVLARHSPVDATWVETGTYLGTTTAFLASRATKVISIEPEPTLFANAVERFRDCSNVTILNGVSETLMPTVVNSLTGNVAFWLDGHYSAGNTFKGALDTPIVEELAAIGDALANWGQVAVLIDDIRLFDISSSDIHDYPERHVLVDWALRHGLSWSIEHDIFIAKNFL